MTADTPKAPLALTLRGPAGDVAGSVLSPDGKFATIQGPFASPPGSTVRGKIAGVTCEVQVKVRGCKRTSPDEPASFRIEGRLQNATRELLAALRGE